MIELDPKYIDVIVKRWQNFSGKEAKLETDGKSFNEIANERKSEQ
jgi:DNA modification methylase